MVQYLLTSAFTHYCIKHHLKGMYSLLNQVKCTEQNFETSTFDCCQILQYWMPSRTFRFPIRSCYWKNTTKRRHTCVKKGNTKMYNHVCTAQVYIHILVVECTTCTMHVAFSWFNSLFDLQLGILNIIEAMNFAPEVVYPLYLSAASDRYSI